LPEWSQCSTVFAYEDDAAELKTPFCSVFFNGAAQESNLPTDGLRRLTGLKVCYERSI